jgi:hypothetical protein
LCDEFLTSAKSFSISQDFLDLLSDYSGVLISRTSKPSLLFLVKELIDQKALMVFSALVFKENVTSVVCQTMNATVPGSTRKEKDNNVPSVVCFPWAQALLKIIREEFTYDILEKLGNEAVKHVWNRIENDHELATLFALGAKASGVESNGDETVLFVRDSICVKVFHARIEVVFRNYRAENTGRLSKKGAGLSLRENLKVLLQRTVGSKMLKEEAPLELDDDWFEEMVDYDGGGSYSKVATKIGEEIGVKIKQVSDQKAAHEVATAKKAAAANNATKLNKKRKKNDMRKSLRKRLFVVYPT